MTTQQEQLLLAENAELQKELVAKNRELEIEAALEKVRSRSLAMHKSDELTEVVQTVFERLNDLNIEFFTAIIVIFTEGSRDCVWWLVSKINKQPSILIKYADVPYLRDLFEAKEKGKGFLSACYSGEDKKAFYDHLLKHTDFRHVPEEQKQLLLEKEFATMYVALTKNIGIHITRYTDKLFSEREKEIIIRFSRVFDQTYTRFLDLQKAEAQAREAKIEAALEKVRSKAVAMHKSEELIEVIASVFQQLEQLSFRVDSANLFLNYKENPFKFWMAVPGYFYPAELDVPYGDFALMNRFIQEIKSNATLVAAKFNQEEKNEWVRHLIQHTIVGQTPDEKKKQMFEAPGLAMSVVGVKNIALAVTNYSMQSYSDEENEILRRFVIVFDQTYTRFLDLQKAEAQAREAQIEAALERVRSRTTGMQKSEELREVIQMVFEQLRHLDFNIDSAHFNLNYKESDDYHLWSAAPGQPYPVEICIPYFDHLVFIKAREAKEKGLDFFTENYTQDEKNKFFEHLFKHIPVIPEERKKYILSGKGIAASTVLMNTISLWVINYAGIPYSEAENAILKRFGKIFEHSHTRFLDLQKAEAQARESQIQLALERVRARTMAMQRSEELPDVATILFQQVKALGVPQWTCGFNIWEIGDTQFTFYAGNHDDQIVSPCKVPLTEDAVFILFDESRRRGDELYVYESKGEIQKEHYRYMSTLPGALGEMLQNMLKAGMEFPVFQIDHIANFSHGNLLFITYEHFPQMHDIFKRFAKVFEQTYARFNDLQKAEAQALEGIKRASVDRVRAEIASMRTTNDLERITPLIWNELTTLSVPFIRCGVFIMDEENQQIETHLSTPGGLAIATFNLPYNAPGETEQILAHWYKKELYKQHWNEARFVEFSQNLVQQGAITSGEKYLTENHPTDLYLHFLPFLQGMLYAGNAAPLSDDALQLMQNLADAFSVAYARYEDFNKLEAAKQQVDKTLVDLKQAQKQLIQSEKMASLGELTAGIAHEIQNPLNFVNNFSEVNKEMLTELGEEIDKGNYSDAKAIAKDVIANEEKINHHGKRADAIVKNMLQHSKQTKGVKEPTDINPLCDEYLRLSYHGLRAKDKNFNATIKTDFDQDIGTINIIPQEIGRVLLNLYNNAFYAVNQRKNASANSAGQPYEPKVTVSTKAVKSPSGGLGIELTVKDNGNGIPHDIVDKIFQPFFTTKPTGQGTGLGLSLSYDIIKAHGGEIKVQTKEGEARPDDPVGRGTTFIIQLPII